MSLGLGALGSPSGGVCTEADRLTRRGEGGGALDTGPRAARLVRTVEVAGNAEGAMEGPSWGLCVQQVEFYLENGQEPRALITCLDFHTGRAPLEGGSVAEASMALGRAEGPQGTPWAQQALLCIQGTCPRRVSKIINNK